MFTKFFAAAAVVSLGAISLHADAQEMLAANIIKKGALAKKDSATAATTATELITGKKQAAQTAAEDTSWKPQRRLWGYAFGDLYFMSHAAPSAFAGETNYAGVPTYRNAFQFRRMYLGYDYEITKKFKAEVLLASEPNGNTGAASGTTIQSGDNLVDGKMAFWIKNFNLRVRDLWTGTDFVIGEMSTPGFALNEPGTNGPTSLSESEWGYRSIERTITDFHKNNSYDIGASLQGTFDPQTKNFGYVIMVGNNSTSSLLSAGNPGTGFYKAFYGDIWGKFLNDHLHVDIYGHYMKTAPGLLLSGVNVGDQSNSMFKIFADYKSKPITIGVEAYTQTFKNGITSNTKSVLDPTVHGLSIWAKGAIVKSLNYFARFDTYNPYTDFDPSMSYTFNNPGTAGYAWGSYTPTVKEHFWTAGLDYNPTKNVHFMPNLWLLDSKDQRASTASTYVAPDHTLVYRFTFYFTFGK